MFAQRDLQETLFIRFVMIKVRMSAVIVYIEILHADALLNDANDLFKLIRN